MLVSMEIFIFYLFYKYNVAKKCQEKLLIIKQNYKTRPGGDSFNNKNIFR